MRRLLWGLNVLAWAVSFNALAQSQTWTRATNDIPWAPRVGEAIVSHDGKLWMLGGSLDERAGCRNDVWVSEDGVVWEQVLEEAPWIPRNGHAAVSFDGRIWVMGGFDCNRYFVSDVWSSADGITWEQASNPPWEPRDGLTAIVYKEKLWVLGGGLDDRDLHNDVWYTENGVEWVQAIAHAPWEARTRFATVVHDNKLWVLAGRTGFSGWVRDVWFTEDGTTWESAGDVPWKGRYNLASVSHGGRLWIFGGQVGLSYDDNAESNEIWSTVDGTDWVLEREHADWSPRTDHTVLPFQDKLYLLGGSSPLGDGTEAWVSDDGVAWSNALGERWGPRTWPLTVLHDGYIWVIGGFVPQGEPNDIWRSRNGYAWEKVPYEASWKRLANAAAVSFRGRIWVLGARDFLTDEACVWSSADGSVWEEAKTPPWTGRMGHSVTVYDDKMWLIGGLTQTREKHTGFHNDVWYSEDGQEWHEAKSGDGEYEKGLAQIGARGSHGAAVYDGKLWIAGGLDVQWHCVGDVWWTTNGYEWTEATEQGPFLQLEGAELVAFKDHLWLVGGNSSSSGDEGGSGQKVWMTRDGSNWASYGGNAPWAPRQDPGIVVLDERLWLLGSGGLGGNNRRNDIWFTAGDNLPEIPDRIAQVVPEEQIAEVNLARKPPKWLGTLGVDWIAVATDRESPDRTQTQPFVFDGMLWLHDGNQFWRTNDGKKWERLPAARDFYEKPWTPYGTGVVHRGQLWDIRSNQGGWGTVWTSDNGMTWRPAKESIEWEAGGGWACAFQDRLWYIGGMRPVDWTNQPQPVSRTWASEDGEHWEIVNEHAPWEGVEGYEHFIFADKMWIVGGRDHNGQLGGIWTSEDGKAWKDASEDAETYVPPAEDPQLFSTGDRLWALTNTRGAARSLFSSADGVNWEKHVENLVLEQGEAYFGILHNGLWLVPRREAHYYESPGTIFHSYTMKSWRAFTFGGPTREMSYNGFSVHDDQFWLFDSKPGEAYTPFSRVFRSGDGANWTLVTDSPAWGERGAFGTVSHAGRLWLFGGHDGGRSDGNPGKAYNDVWSSEDGKDWIRVAESAPWEPRMEPYAVSLRGKIILLCGDRERTSRYDKPWLRDAWETADGIHWEQLTAEVPFRLSRDFSPPFVYDGKIWAIGADGEDESKIWNSVDGAIWTSVLPDKTWVPRYSVGAFAHDGRIWAVGGITEWERKSDVLPHRPVDRVEWSKDGISWSVVSTLPLDPQRNYDNYYSMGGRMWRVSFSPDGVAFSGAPNGTSKK